jgi:hypothetical protein
VAALSRAEGLISLDLSSSDRLTDKALKTFAGLRGLQVLELTRCKQISPEGIRELEKNRPDLIITYNRRSN